MNSSAVSIIIPTYNYGHYIRDAIESALAQKGVQVELIVVDDGSTDNTREICESYGDRLLYLYQKNSGPSVARNLGLQHSKAPFVLFLDSDDILLSNMVAELTKKFDELGKDYAIVACLTEHIDSKGNIQRDKPLESRGDWEVLLQDLLIRNYFNPSSALIRREALNQVDGFDGSLMSSEERDLWIRIGLNHRIFLCSAPLIKLRVHPDSYSHNAQRMYENMKQTVANGIRQGGRKFTLLHKLKAYSYCEFDAFWMYNGEGQHTAAAIHLIKSWLYLPWFPGIKDLGYKRFFRLRAVRHFLLSLCRAERK